MILVRKTCDSRIVVTVLKYIVSLNTMEVGDAENQLFLLMLGRTMDMLMGKGKGRPSFCCCFGRRTGGRSPLLLGARSSGHRKRRGGRQRRRRCRRGQHPGEGKGRVGHAWSSASWFRHFCWAMAQPTPNTPYDVHCGYVTSKIFQP